MEGILAGYDVNHATWFYLSFLLVVAVYFRFNRLLSVRNLDLALLLSIAPGLLLLQVPETAVNAEYLKNSGYWWLLAASAMLLARVLCDAWFARRPRLEQNLNTSGLAFLCIASFAFLTTSALRGQVAPSSQRTAQAAESLLKGNRPRPVDDTKKPATSETATDDAEPQPEPPLATPVVTATVTPFSPENDDTMTARIASILSHVGVIVGLWLIGFLHFKDGHLGVAMATLYLLLPPTSYHATQLNHVLPAALVVWAFVTVRRPVGAGVLLGLACGMQVFALFLLPLWLTWFGRRGALKFGLSWLATMSSVVALVVVTSQAEAMEAVLARVIDWSYLLGDPGNVGYWRIQHAAYRVPAFVGFLVMLAALVIWPLGKNLEQLIARTAAVVVATQFWYPSGNDLCVLWYLPLLLLVTFRPNVDRFTFEQTEELSDDEDLSPDRPPVTPSRIDAGSRYVFH